MPTKVMVDGSKLDVATKEEILEFVNKIRKIGGAEELNDLIPAYRNDMESCLIAKAVNFESNVEYLPWIGRWTVMFPSCELAKRIRDELSLDGEGTFVFLPEEIGNSAAAFDDGAAFIEYAISC